MSAAGLRSQWLAAWRSGDRGRAERLLGAALERTPADPFWRSAQASCLAAAGEGRQALRLADALLLECPADPLGLLARADALVALGRDREAEAALEAAWNGRPIPYVALRLARLYAAGDPERAIAFARRALERFPGHLRLLVALGSLLERTKRATEAEEVYRRAASAYGGRGDEFAYARWLRLRLAGHDPAAALTELEQVLRVPSRARNAELLGLRADLLTRVGRHDEAAAVYAAAAALLPGGCTYTARRAFALRRAGRHSEAQRILEQVIEARPDDVAALSAYVADARGLGRAVAARGFLRGVLGRHPERRALWGWLKRLARKG